VGEANWLHSPAKINAANQRIKSAIKTIDNRFSRRGPVKLSLPFATQRIFKLIFFKGRNRLKSNFPNNSPMSILAGDEPIIS
jgi:hypothetical protein